VKPNTISRIRKALGLTQAEAGKLFGGGPRAFTKYESGEVKPSAGLQRLLYCADKFPTMLGVLGIAVATGKFDESEENDADILPEAGCDAGQEAGG
jgi:transcriptional regulator with XRE-family HTH domain